MSVRERENWYDVSIEHDCSCYLLKELYKSLRREALIQASKFIQKIIRLTVQGQVHIPEQCSSVSLIQVGAGCEVGCHYS